MRIAFVGDFVKDWSTEAYIADALSKQPDVDVLRFQESTFSSYLELTGVLKKLSPNVLLFSKMRTRINYHTADLLLKIRQAIPDVKVVCWFFDLLRSGYGSRWRSWAERVVPECDLFLTTDGGLAEEFPSVKCNVKLLRQGYGGPIEKPSPTLPKSGQIGHLGELYGNRYEWYSRIEMAFPEMRHYRTLRGDVLFGLMDSLALVVGPNWPNYPRYWSNRIYVVTGYGGLSACPTVEGMAEEGWSPGENYTALSPKTEDAIDELKYVWLTLPEHELQKIRDAGRELVLSRHTYDHRAAELVKMLKEL